MSDGQRWFPVARSEEVVPRHIVDAMLLGQELAVWRDAAGVVNAWENRCPHRGVRLSIGYNTGLQLRCQYHGWTFESGSGRCRFIPAHPSQKPAATIGARPFRVAESAGYVWVQLEAASEAGAEAPPAAPGASAGITLRSRFMNVPAVKVARALQAGYELQGAGRVPVEALDAWTLATTDTGGHAARMLFRLQPVDDGRSIVHSSLGGVIVGSDSLRFHNAQLSALRRSLEMTR